jgi:coenzyme F420-0:L-glutamate ligase/coenzyme F420-1:gamma-L-glutamate ligase
VAIALPKAQPIDCSPTFELRALPGVPIIRPGDDLAVLVQEALDRAELKLRDGDVLVVTSKAFSRAQNRYVDLQTVEVSSRAREVAEATQKDPRLVELILREAASISRQAPGVLIVRHRLGFIGANASIDCSNAVPPGAAPGAGPWALLLPESPDGSAEELRARLERWSGASIGIVVSDSLGRPFRFGTVGAAVGVAGLPALWDRRGETDLFGRVLELTITALADQVAAAADLVAGQASEGRPFVLVRGLTFPTGQHSAAELLRPPDADLYA